MATTCSHSFRVHRFCNNSIGEDGGCGLRAAFHDIHLGGADKSDVGGVSTIVGLVPEESERELLMISSLRH